MLWLWEWKLGTHPRRRNHRTGRRFHFQGIRHLYRTAPQPYSLPNSFADDKSGSYSNSAADNHANSTAHSAALTVTHSATQRRSNA